MVEENERVIRERIERTRERLGETIEEIGERVNPDHVQRALKARARKQVDELKANVKRKARNTMRDVEDGVTETGRGVWERARQWGHEAQYRARRAEHRVEDSVQGNPITAGAIAAALGFAAGMMIPESRKENEMFGPTRDRLMDRAQGTVRLATEKAKEAARETVEEVSHGRTH